MRMHTDFNRLIYSSWLDIFLALICFSLGQEDNNSQNQQNAFEICVAFIKLSARCFSTSLKQAPATSSFCNLAGVVSGLPFWFSSGNFSSATCLFICMIYSSPDLLTVSGQRHVLETAQSLCCWNVFASAQCWAPLQHLLPQWVFFNERHRR